jgi:acetyl esterase/lipase
MIKIMALLLAALGNNVMAKESPLLSKRLDIAYQPAQGGDPTRALLDVYQPTGAVNAPVLVFWHGGALMRGDKQLVTGLALALASQGVVVVAANHRLSPAVQHPVHLEDAAAAVNWVKIHIADYGGNPQLIFLGGHSAGAYLSVQLALDSRYLAAHDMALPDIAGVAAISPFLYVEEVAPVRSKVVWGSEPSGWLAPSVTPYIGSGKPPMRLIYAQADDDWRRKQNERLATALAAVKVDARAAMVLARDHTTIMTRADEAADPVVKLIYQFVTGDR